MVTSTLGPSELRSTALRPGLVTRPTLSMWSCEEDSCLLDCVIGVQSPEAGRGLHRYVLAALPVIVGRKSRKCCVN